MSTTKDGPNKGDLGAEIVCTVYERGAVLPITGATNLRIYFERPDKTYFYKTGAFKTDGSDGKIKYVTTSVDDLDVAGQWHVQGYFTLSGWTGHSDMEVLPVYENVEDAG